MSTNDFIDDFIEEYRNQPCLWKANSANYKNRTKRQEAYMKLIEVAAKHGEHYNIERTKQKINNLRCAFRHQLKKYTECKNNKSGKEEPYCPKRRYFESLMFLMEEEKPENRIKLAEKFKEIKLTRVITRKDNQPIIKKDLMQQKNEPMKIAIETIESSNGGDHQEEVIELDHEESERHQLETGEMQEESENCTVHSEDISVAGESVKDAGGVVYHTDVQQSDDDEESYKIIWPVNQSNQIDGIQTNYIRMAPQQSPTTQQPAHSQTSATSGTISTPLTTTIIHHDLTNSGHTSSATQIALPTSITIQPVPKSETVISPDGIQHNTIRRRTISMCSNKSQSVGTAENYESSSQEPSAKKVKIDCASSDFEKLLSLACSKMNAPDAQSEDNFSMFGKIVAHKMRNMDPQQAMFAEKIIFDILFEGQMKVLKYPYPVSTQYGISTGVPVTRSTIYPLRHSGTSQTTPGSIVATSSQQQQQTFVISSVDCHGTPTEIHATNSAHQAHYSPQNAHYTTTTTVDSKIEE